MAHRSLASRYLHDMHVDDEDEEHEELLLQQLEEERLVKERSKRAHGGSVMGHRVIHRDLIGGHERLYSDYFANPPKYGPRLFRRRFRMNQALFLRIHDAVVAHDNYFAKEQEGARKDVERAFGVLQACFAIVRGPTRFWEKDTLHNIMTACIIIHNMIIEDERDNEGVHQRRMHNIDNSYDRVDEIPMVSASFERTPTLMEFIENRHRMRNSQMHSQLQEDLVEHLWKIHGRC